MCLVPLIEWFSTRLSVCGWLYGYVLIVRLVFYDVRMRILSKKKERIVVRISKTKEEQMICEDEVQGQIANQGKPPLDAYLVLNILLLHYYKFL